MNYRTAMLAAAACAAAISLAACTVTTTASPASAGSTVSVSGPIGRFPLPPGAQLINDGTDNGHYDIVFGSVSPSEASRFYTTALPRAATRSPVGRERTTAAAPAMAGAAAPSWPREAPARGLEGSAAKAGSNVEIGQCRASRAHA